jgi:hypothetical protein
MGTGRTARSVLFQPSRAPDNVSTTDCPPGVPHVNQQSSEYNGYHIPKGSYLHANIGCILRDPEVYDSPSVFDPDRFLNEVTPEPTAVFGYGRRYVLMTCGSSVSRALCRGCPGKVLADHVNFYTLLNVLWAFRIDVIPGERRPEPEDMRFVDAAIRCVPVPGICIASITPPQTSRAF